MKKRMDAWEIRLEQKSEEKAFEEYREHLKNEGAKLARFIRVYRLLAERHADSLDELNIAPCFFQTVEEALLSAIVSWIHKLFAEDSERGLHNFLGFVEQHQAIFSIDAVKRRRGISDGDWRIARTRPVDNKTVESDRIAITGLEPLKSVKLRRDKFHSHFDKRYFFDRKRIAQDAPLTWSDLDNLVGLFKNILNRYSAAYDGQVFRLEPLDINDLNFLLERLRQAS
jgi:AbiU2